jgi:hypothetical protein
MSKKNSVGKKYGLVFGPATIQKNLDEIVEIVDRKRGYAQLSFDIKNLNGRHAICSYKSSGKVFGIGSHLYVFDPNYGEFRVPTGNIKEFYRGLFAVYGGSGNVGSLRTHQVEASL